MILSQEAIALLSQRGTVAFRWLFWVEARNRFTGEKEAVGFWNGADDRVFQVGGGTRLYVGVGALLKVPSLIFQPGAVVRMQSVDFMGISDQLEQALLDYDTRQAPTELHLALFDPESMNLVTIEAACRGWLNRAPAKFGGTVGGSGIRAIMASISRLMTRTLPVKKSHANQKSVLVKGSPDGFRRYGSISNASTWWGEKRKVAIPKNETTNTASDDTAVPDAGEWR